ncbi:lactococcin 972 family bacteriocin [Peptacetobacter sp.]|uniref:lactococcin 972 family bacteriocin n=1 Tax=Peptacetobacter sp. TaxID=2991975 RepID=UPI0026342150|nr:lactococcin 972 family bacteriocin [Peptacetobacter sp.]MEE0452194.1 lactococcin 972 family bacteriocin [Peptacetobacter sp.]
MKKNKFLALGLVGILLVAPMSIGAEELETNNNEFEIVKEFGDVVSSGNSASVNFDSVVNDKTRIKVTGYGESHLGGGVWTYGLSATNVWSRYKNPVRQHETSVKNKNGYRSSGPTKRGVDAIASLTKARTGNEAFAKYTK